MEQDRYIEKLHCELIEILDEIVRVCEVLNLNYYLTGGTLLGAVRHGGFIPWDDDLDIVMDRNDFECFVHNAPKYLKDDFYLSWLTTDKKYFRLYAKVCKKNTLFLETIGNHSSSFGIFVDIFPLDYSDGDKSKIHSRKKIIKALGNMLTEKKADSNYSGAKKILTHILPEKLLLSMAQHLMRLENKHSTKLFYVNYGSQYPIERWTICYDYFGKGCASPFENRVYNIPIKYEEVLSSIFGENFMQLPPENKRKTHYPLKVKFSDGVIMTFEQNENRLSIKDTLE